MRDYWLSKLFYDLQDPKVAAEYRENRESVLARYPIDEAAKKALEEDDVPLLASRINPYLLRFYCYGIGMKDEEFMRRLRDG
jgi:hypothetical protein